MGSSLLHRFWYALPIDGRGLIGPADPDARRLIALATRRRFSMIPRPLLPPVVAAARLLYCLKAAFAVRRAAQRFGFGARESWRAYADACLFGLRPKDSYSWRCTMTERRPLSTQAFWKIQSAIGDAAQQHLLGDKLATAAVLNRFGVATPKQLAVIAAGTEAPVLPDATDMFVKPRNGSRGRNAFSITRLAPGKYWIDGAERDEAYAMERLRKATAHDDLLVQERLTGTPDLADLGTPEGVPPVLRLMTACEPHGQPFLHSGHFAIRVPGQPPSHPILDGMRVPIAIATGSLLTGRWLGAPRIRFDKSPWHKAQIAGRVLPGFDTAAAAAIDAARAFPGLPLIGWDVILTGAGPVILEGNSCSDWLFVSWMDEGAPDAVPLLQLFQRWAEQGTSPRQATASLAPCTP